MIVYFITTDETKMNPNFSPTPEPSTNRAPDTVDMTDDDLTQYSIDVDGGLYDQAKAEDANREKQQHRQDNVERFVRVSKRIGKAMGNAALREILPFATEFVQRNNSHKRMKYGNSSVEMPKKPVIDSSASALNKFTGSVNDFKEIRVAEKKAKKLARESRQAKLKEFLS